MERRVFLKKASVGAAAAAAVVGFFVAAAGDCEDVAADDGRIAPGEKSSHHEHDQS